MLPTPTALPKFMEATWTQHPWKLVQNVISWVAVVFQVVCFELLWAGTALSRTMKRVFFLTWLALPWPQKHAKSSTTFKPRNFPETTMQLFHKTFDWKHATSFTPFQGPALALWTYLGPPFTHKMQWTCWLHSHLPSTSLVVSTLLQILCSVFLFMFKMPSSE